MDDRLVKLSRAIRVLLGSTGPVFSVSVTPYAITHYMTAADFAAHFGTMPFTVSQRLDELHAHFTSDGVAYVAVANRRAPEYPLWKRRLEQPKTAKRTDTDLLVDAERIADDVLAAHGKETR